MKNDGGPAFPNNKTEQYLIGKDDLQPKDGSVGYEITENFPGMSLRDYFAAAAMQGLLAGGDLLFDTEETKAFRLPSTYVLASNAYQIADAMLRECQK